MSDDSVPSRPHPWWQRRCYGPVIGTHYEPPADSFESGPIKARGSGAQTLMNDYLRTVRKAIEGFTTLTYRCSRCGRIWTTTQPGKVTGHA